MNKIMMDGEPLEVGDKIYSLSKGYGEVVRLDYDSQFPIACKFAHGVINAWESYTTDFKVSADEDRTLYWQKPEIISPPKIKPKKRITVWDWFVEWPNGVVGKLIDLTEWQARKGARIAQKIDGTEREIEVDD